MNENNNDQPTAEELEVVQCVKEMYEIYFNTLEGFQDVGKIFPFTQLPPGNQEAWFNVFSVAVNYAQKKIQTEMREAKRQQEAEAKALEKTGKIIQIGEKKIIRPN